MSDCKYYDVFCWLEWLTNELRLVLIGLYTSILESITDLLSAIPAPDFLIHNMPSLPPSIIFWANFFMLHYGLGLVVSAYMLRFLVRRLPIIG